MRGSARSLVRSIGAGRTGRLHTRVAPPLPRAFEVAALVKGKERADCAGSHQHSTAGSDNSSQFGTKRRSGWSTLGLRHRPTPSPPQTWTSPRLPSPPTYLAHTLHTSALASDATRPSPRPPTSSPVPPPSHPPPPPSPLPGGLGTTQLSPDILLRCTIFDASGAATSTSGIFKKSHLCAEHGLEPRDLRKIDSRVPNLVPTILARRGGILVNILHIRAMVKRDKVLLFDSYGSTDSQLHSAFVYNLQHNLRGGGGMAYEFRALESILVSVLDALRIELGVVRGWTSRVLDELDDDVDREKLRELLGVSRKLNAFLSRGRAVKGAVTEVLENDEDMMLMYLSSPSGTPPASNPTATASASASASDELELLLESFDKQVEEVIAETSQLHSDMTNTQEVVELILDNNRNKLLALDLKTSIATMGISAGTLWAGLFGMNLRSNLEEVEWAFVGVSGVACVAVLVVAGVGLRRLERLRRVGLGMKRAKKGWVEMFRGRGERERGEVGPAAYGGYGAAHGAYGPGYGGAAAGNHLPGSGYGQAWTGAPPAPGAAEHHPAWWAHSGYQPSHAGEFAAHPGNPTPPPPAQHPHTRQEGGPEDAQEAALGMGLGSKWDASSGTSGLARRRRGNEGS